MENNQQSKWIWGLIAIIIVIVLVLIAKKSNNPPPLKDAGTETTANENTSNKQASSQSQAGELAPAQANNIVEYTEAGFKPFILNVIRGESVEFVNKSDKSMTIRSHRDNPKNFYPGFSQESGPLGRGGKFYFTFTLPGAWSYYNLNGNKEEGVIYVR